MDRNIVLSPRNEKHFYLLKGLTQCNGCKSRYVGDPCHGKFFYRCHARRKRCPMVKEEDLNEAVLGAVRELVHNPRIVLEQVARLNERNDREAELLNQKTKEADLELKRIATEEKRILEAYRLGIISPRQLGSECEQIRSRRNALQAQSGDPSVQQPDRALAQGCIRDYCAEAAYRFDRLGPEELREFLRTIIRNILFDGTTVRIQGEIPIPVPAYGHAEAGGPNQCAGTADSRIATTVIGLHGRNPAGSSLQPHSVNVVQLSPYSFEMATAIVRKRQEQPHDELGRFKSAKPGTPLGAS